jgi:hypothetical protein
VVNFGSRFQKVLWLLLNPDSVNPLGFFVYMLNLSMVRLLLVLLLLALGVFP